jgi:hypothetical protein
MSFFAAFACSFGSALLLMALIAAWLFRTSAAPLWTKLAAPAALVAVCCLTPYAVGSMLGLPRLVAFSDLPDKAELLAFVPHDDAGLVDLWLAASGPPRAYETALDPKLKQALRAARERMDRGGRAMLVKRAGSLGDSKGKTAIGNADEASEYVLAPDAAMPSKE